MQSPVHPDVTMQLVEIEPGLQVYTCPKSGGIWIPLQNFLEWKEHRKDFGSPLPPGYVAQIADDSHSRILICPESGRLLLRYRVGHGLNFHVDRSPATGGVWLDKGEWEALRNIGLHAELNLIFTASYQRQIRTTEYEETLDRAFASRIGEDDFQKVVAFKKWLAGHPRRRDIHCYLQHDLDVNSELGGPTIVTNPAA